MSTYRTWEETIVTNISGRAKIRIGLLVQLLDLNLVVVDRLASSWGRERPRVMSEVRFT
jgi:hypothetical protein